MKTLDPLDVEILMALQGDGRASMAEIGKEIGLSASAVTRRLEKLEADRVILGYAPFLYRLDVTTQKVTSTVLPTLDAAPLAGDQSPGVTERRDWWLIDAKGTAQCLTAAIKEPPTRRQHYPPRPPNYSS